jgi:transposase
MTQKEGKDFWLGVDLAQDTFDACVAPVQVSPQVWRKLPVGHFENSPEGIQALGQWLTRPRRDGQCLGVVVESTGQLSARFAGALAPLGLPVVSIINPARSVSFARTLGVRQKSDRIDGALLAVYGAIYLPAPTQPKPEAQQNLRELDRLREALSEDLTCVRNRLREAQFAPARRILETQWRQLEAALEELERELDKALAANPELERQAGLLDTVVGIGPVVARTLTAEVGDLRHYSRGEIVALAGLFPRTHDSGKSVHKKPRLAGGGGGRLRRVLFLAALAIQRSRGVLKRFGQHLLEQGKNKMCMLGALMRKLLLIGRAVVKSGKPYNPVEAGRSRPAQMMKEILIHN